MDFFQNIHEFSLLVYALLNGQIENRIVLNRELLGHIGE